jgi:hypothetical protein
MQSQSLENSPFENNNNSSSSTSLILDTAKSIFHLTRGRSHYVIIPPAGGEAGGPTYHQQNQSATGKEKMFPVERRSVLAPSLPIA